MKYFTIYYSGCVKYLADSKEEVKAMFKNAHFTGRAMDIDEIEEEEIEEDD